MNKPRIILAGGSGFLGTVLARHFAVNNWEIIVLTRAAPRLARSPVNTVKQVLWDGRTLGPWQELLEGADALVNLSGRSIKCRYTKRNRRQLLESRIKSTQLLGEAISRCGNPPRVWLNCSGVDIYRESFAGDIDESSPDSVENFPNSNKSTSSLVRPTSFSSQVAHVWERAFEEARVPATRKITLRISMVLGAEAGTVFPVFRRLARAGLAGPLGNGKQYVSWIHERDFCRSVEWLVRKPDLDGPINVTTPNPVTNEEFMRCLRQAAGRSFGLPAARWMLEMSAFCMRTETELILKSRRVVPRRLLASGFEFRFPELRGALQELERRVMTGEDIT